MSQTIYNISNDRCFSSVHFSQDNLDLSTTNFIAENDNPLIHKTHRNDSERISVKCHSMFIMLQSEADVITDSHPDRIVP